MRTQSLEVLSLDKNYPIKIKNKRKYRTFKGINLVTAVGKFGTVKNGYTNRLGYQRADLSENIVREGDY